MSYDLAVWEGERPADDAEAARVFARISERIGSDDPPSDTIRAFVEELLHRWPEDDDQVDDSPWATGPLIGEAFGDAIYFAVTPSRAAEVAAVAGRSAARLGLVCYDPQQSSILPGTDDIDIDDGAPPRSARDWLTWLRRTIFG